MCLYSRSGLPSSGAGPQHTRRALRAQQESRGDAACPRTDTLSAGMELPCGGDCCVIAP